MHDEMPVACITLARKPEKGRELRSLKRMRKIDLRRFRRRWEDNVKMR
jgi:hypothetical protein